jgi:hypothetical protein
MFSEYIAAALARAEYEVIDNPEPYYAHVPGIEGVWATGGKQSVLSSIQYNISLFRPQDSIRSCPAGGDETHL